MNLSQKIKQYAQDVVGFDACGFCQARAVAMPMQDSFRQWIDEGRQADMKYMEEYFDKRTDPTLLVENAKSVICVALNYYPKEKQPEENPQIAYYAYGKDYHDVMKDRLRQLFDYIRELVPTMEGRVFCDTAPVMERYWAAQSGIGFVGKNSLLIIPRRGSYFFLGELIVDIELEYDQPLRVSCGSCTKCMDACPTQAIVSPQTVDSCRCISYQTIENRGEMDDDVVSRLNNRFYGCDICQQVCPCNRFATPNRVDEFSPKEELFALSAEEIEHLSVENYQRIFKGSAIKRAKLAGLKRNAQALRKRRD